MNGVLTILLAMLTTYSNGTFHTAVTDTAQASLTNSSATIDTLIHYIQCAPLRISTWPTAGCGHQEDSRRDAIYLYWKDSKFDPATHYSSVLLDVWVDGKPKFTDVMLESVVTDSVSPESRTIRVDIYYSGSLLKEAYGIFHLNALTPEMTRVNMEVHIKFGWFFRLFISRKVYSQTIDWRAERFLRNIALFSQGIVMTDEDWK